jgi:hypothetical protein
MPLVALLHQLILRPGPICIIREDHKGWPLVTLLHQLMLPTWTMALVALLHQLILPTWTNLYHQRGPQMLASGVAAA